MKRSRRRSNKRRRHRRRHNYGAAVANPRRRRRRHAGAAVKHYRRRRRNPISPYSSGGYRRAPNRRRNPGMFDFDELMDVVPAATGGVFAARFALKQAGAWEADKATGVLEPGIKQAIALWIGAHLGGQLIGSMLGDTTKGNVARIAALGYAGDLFARARFFKDSDWMKNNLSLQGPEYTDTDELNGFQSQSALGAYEDAMGNRWMQDGSGNWVLAGMGAEPNVVDINGTLYQLSGMGLDSRPGSGADLAGFQSTSALGFHRGRSSRDSSFGYSTGD